jgi:predicted metalloendopeptidase
MQSELGLDTENLSKSIRPQDDLFRHLNSTWIEQTAIPADKAVYGSFHILADEAELAVRDIIEDASKNPAPGVSQQIGDLYASFMNEELIEKLGWQPIRHEIDRVYGAAMSITILAIQPDIWFTFIKVVSACRTRPTTARKSTPIFGLNT